MNKLPSAQRARILHHFAYYNFFRIHQTLRMTPAMAAGVTDKLWEVADLVAVLEATEAKPGKRGSYKKANHVL